VFDVDRERRRVPGQTVGNLLDLDVEPQFAEQVMEAPVELGHGHTVFESD
jgi:hypothetical protein